MDFSRSPTAAVVSLFETTAVPETDPPPANEAVTVPVAPTVSPPPITVTDTVPGSTAVQSSCRYTTPLVIVEVELVISVVEAEPRLAEMLRTDPRVVPPNETEDPCDDTIHPQTAVNEAVHFTSSPTAYSISLSVHL